MKQNFVPILNEDFYVWVARDGHMQLTTIAPDWISCEAIAKLLHKAGVGQSPYEMRLKGFDIVKVRVKIEAADNIKLVAFHHWMMQATDGDREKLIALLKSEVINNANPQAFELLEATGMPMNKDHIFGNAIDMMLRAFAKEKGTPDSHNLN